MTPIPSDLTEELEHATQEYRRAVIKLNEAHEHLLEIERKFELLINQEEVELENTYS